LSNPLDKFGVIFIGNLADKLPSFALTPK